MPDGCVAMFCKSERYCRVGPIRMEFVGSIGVPGGGWSHVTLSRNCLGEDVPIHFPQGAAVC